jgi:iron complex transport system substrate-binding protein
MMRRTFFLVIFIAVCFVASFTAKVILERRNSAVSRERTGTAPLSQEGSGYERIVSLAPSITENLYALGLMDSVVGVTRYCDYPPEALLKTQVGGYYDPNYEAIVALHPDLIVMLAEAEDPREYLSRLGFHILVVDHRSIAGILESIEKIGEACGVPDKARSITGDLRARMRRIEQKTSGLPAPRVLISIGRNMGSGRLDDVYISGKEGFYDQMIELLGGVNAYEGSVAFPVVSHEGIIQMNPDVIIDMVPDLAQQGWTPEMIQSEWDAVSHVNAVKNGRVYIFGDDFVAVPGPRFISIMEKMARAMYPDVDWDDPPSPGGSVQHP